MSRNSVLSRPSRLLTCEICGSEIMHDMARVDEGRVYHVRCFRRHLAREESVMYECPKCSTLGGTWHWRRKEWLTCDLCSGSGYLAPAAGVAER